MKWVVSVSLGSPERDHRYEGEILGEEVVIERRGTGGDWRAAAELIEALDGRVSAIGLGGINLRYVLGNRRYSVRGAGSFASLAKQTPVADGERFKLAIEPMVVGELSAAGFEFRGKRALVVSVLDRWALARALEEAGCRVYAGDVLFALGLPVVFPGTGTFQIAGLAAMPFLRLLPIGWLYPGHRPMSERPQKPLPWRALARWVCRHAVERADYVAGDFHFMRKGIMGRLDGKVVIASTLRDADVEDLLRRGAAAVVSCSPAFGGRCFGANVMEALICAFDGRRPEDIPAEEMRRWWGDLGLKPHVWSVGRSGAVGVGDPGTVTDPAPGMIP